MNARAFVCIMSFFALAARAATVRADDAVELLAKADGFRAGFDSFVSRVRITNQEGDRRPEEAEFEVSSRGENSFIRFLSARNKGQAVLMRGDDMWLLLPAVARPVRITPIQRLMGNAANGDIARMRYTTDYTPSIVEEATLDGEPVAVLELKAKRKGATYTRILYMVRRRDGRPLRADFFLTSGKPMKSATFGGLRELGGRPMLTRLVIQDVVKSDSRSTVDILELAPARLPDKLFNPVRSEGE
jgi:outer membrane lipoprotein-sorting protein